MKTVLLLNSSEEVLTIIPWYRAVSLLLSGRAKAPWNYEDVYEIPTNRDVYRLPTAIVLEQYVKIPFKSVSATRGNIMRRDNFSCQYCGCGLNDAHATVDHVVPASRGGQWSWKNLVLACKPCNNKKADRTPGEAGMKLRNPPVVPTRFDLVNATMTREGRPAWSRWIHVPEVTVS